MAGAGTLASDLESKTGRPAYVSFKTIAKQNKKASEEEGRYIGRDVDMVTVRQIGATDSVEWEVPRWLEQNRIEVINGRLPQEHAEKYAESYKRWKAGQEMPMEGTPIKSWPVISPAQVEVIIQAGIRTVEDLASLNDEGLRRIGMGAVELKQKAKTWIDVSQDKGKVTQEMASVSRQNDQLQKTVETLMAKVEKLQEEMKAAKKPKGRKKADDDEISASELMDE